MTIDDRAEKLVAWMLEISIDEAKAKYEQEIVQTHYEFTQAISDARAAGYAEAKEQYETALESLATAGDDIKEMAEAFVQSRDVNGLRNYGGNIANIARHALAPATTKETP